MEIEDPDDDDALLVLADALGGDHGGHFTITNARLDEVTVAQLTKALPNIEVE